MSGIIMSSGSYGLSIVPSLDLNFVSSSVLDERITFTRNSTATYFDSSGVLQSAANNVARFDYNPATLAARGLLIEEERTNIIRNNTMQGAVVGTPGTLPTNWPSIGTGHGVTQEIIGVGTENGVNYIDIRFFTATTAATNLFVLSAESAFQIAAANGQSWASSWFVKVIAAPLPFSSYTNRIRLNDSGGSGVGQIDTVFTPTSTLTRYTSAGTIAAATAAFVQPQIRFGMTIGQAYDVTIRVGLPQLEQGAFATSVIPTTTTALTRSADDARVNTLSPWYNQSAGTLFVERIQQPIDTISARRYINVCDGTTANSIQKYQATSGISAAVTGVGGVASFGPSPTGTPAQGSVVKTALSFDGISKSMCRDAGTVFTDAIASPTSGMTTMFIGSQLGTAGPAVQFSCTWIRRITYYPRRLNNSELRAITAS